MINLKGTSLSLKEANKKFDVKASSSGDGLVARGRGSTSENINKNEVEVEVKECW